MTPPLLAMLAFECDVVSHNFTAVVVRDAPGASAERVGKIAEIAKPLKSSSRGLAERVSTIASMPSHSRRREAAPPLLVRLRKIDTASTATRRRT